MIPWEKRPREITTLLNPAFCGEIILECIAVYNRVLGSFPFPLLFLILPIILHQKTRDTMPSKSKQMHMWIQIHKEILIGFSDRARNLVPITIESLAFLLHVNALKVDKNGNIESNTKWIRRKISERDLEITDCLSKSRYLAKMFSSSGTLATIFTMWRIRP